MAAGLALTIMCVSASMTTIPACMESSVVFKRSSLSRSAASACLRSLRSRVVLRMYSFSWIVTILATNSIGTILPSGFWNSSSSEPPMPFLTISWNLASAASTSSGVHISHIFILFRELGSLPVCCSKAGLQSIIEPDSLSINTIPSSASVKMARNFASDSATLRTFLAMSAVILLKAVPRAPISSLPFAGIL